MVGSRSCWQDPDKVSSHNLQLGFFGFGGNFSLLFFVQYCHHHIEIRQIQYYSLVYRTLVKLVNKIKISNRDIGLRFVQKLTIFVGPISFSKIFVITFFRTYFMPPILKYQWIDVGLSKQAWVLLASAIHSAFINEKYF